MSDGSGAMRKRTEGERGDGERRSILRVERHAGAPMTARVSVVAGVWAAFLVRKSELSRNVSADGSRPAPPTERREGEEGLSLSAMRDRGLHTCEKRRGWRDDEREGGREAGWMVRKERRREGEGISASAGVVVSWSIAGQDLIERVLGEHVSAEGEIEREMGKAEKRGKEYTGPRPLEDSSRGHSLSCGTTAKWYQREATGSGCGVQQSDQGERAGKEAEVPRE
eukprot:953511-Rhodomonas_salina.1